MEITVVFLCFAFLVGAWRVLDWIWLKPKKIEKRLKEQGFKGSPYKLLFGDYKEIARLLDEAKSNPIDVCDDVSPRIIPHFLQVVNKYGKNPYLWFGTKPLVLIMEPELIKEVTHKYVVFQKSMHNPLFKLLVEGIFFLEGDKWVKHRKIVNPAFHQEKIKFMVPAIYTSASEVLRKWDEIVSPQGSGEVDVWTDFRTLTSDVISRTAFGSNYEQGRIMFELQREQTQHLVKALNSLYIPGWRFLPTNRNRRMKQISKEVNGLIGRIVDSRITSIKEGEACENDLLDMLLKSTYNEDDKEIGLSREEIIEECKIFYFAGQETTSVLLTWTMVFLSRYQNWQNRAREEVLQVVGHNKPEYDGVNRLKIVNMILHEVLRLYPPVAVLNRVTTEETKLGNQTLPAGVLVGLPTLILHTEPEFWGDDAKEFNPERFAEGVSNATKGQLMFFPFGWGPRICVGLNLAMVEAKMALALILQRFSFQLSPSYTHAPTPILHPEHGAHLILHKLF